MASIEGAYCNYCKYNEAAVVKLAEYASPTCPEAIKSFLDVIKPRYFYITAQEPSF